MKCTLFNQFRGHACKNISQRLFFCLFKKLKTFLQSESLFFQSKSTKWMKIHCFWCKPIMTKLFTKSKPCELCNIFEYHHGAASHCILLNCCFSCVHHAHMLNDQLMFLIICFFIKSYSTDEEITHLPAI